MKIHLVTNRTLRCGIAEHGRRTAEALTNAGITVVSNPPADITHVNYHPFIQNYRELAKLPHPLSIYFHDTPDWDTPKEIWDLADVRFTSEPYDGAIEIPYPAVTPESRSPYPDLGLGLPTPRLGYTGLRGDGRGAVEDLAKKRGWRASTGDPAQWSDYRDEIYRLSTCTLNILWYFATGRGKSLAVMVCAAAKRPVVIGDSDMFSAVWPYEDEFYKADGRTLEETVDWAISDGLRRRPNKVLTDLSWPRAVEKMREAWTSLL